MEIQKKLCNTIYFENKAGTQTPCQRFGLDISKLQIDQLFKYRQYRRLYNIVQNDRTTETVYEFRPHLIKQLYFLLQITPFIQNELKQSYLSSIEQWYNSNDFKKVKLSKNLQGMLSNVIKQKTKNKIGRPKSSVGWDKNLNCFLRPYTAKLQRNQKIGVNKENVDHDRSRPASKYTYNKSTCAGTNIINLQDQEQVTIQDRYQNICDIQEQWQRSRDFINKHRTIHPDQQPTYQKLLKIIMNADKGEFSQANYSTTQYHSRSKNKQHQLKTESSNKFDIKQRNIYSAQIKRQNTKLAVREELMGSNKNYDDLNDIMDNNFDGEAEWDEVDQEQEKSIQEFELKESNKVFNSDKRSKSGNRNNFGPGLYTRVNGMRIVRPFTSKQTHIIHKLDNYHHIQNNKKVISNLQDQQLKQKTYEYIRNKGISRKQFSRRTQAKRLVNNLMSNQTKNIKIISSKKNKNNNPLEHKNVQIFLSEPADKFQEKPAYYSVKKLFGAKNKNQIGKQINKLKLLGRNTSQESERSEERNNHRFYMSRPLSSLNQEDLVKQKEEGVFDLPKTQSLTRDTRFDPGHKMNIIQYNETILDDIEKIKMRMPLAYKQGQNGQNNNVIVTTEALMKALYVDPGIQHIQSIDQYLKRNASQKLLINQQKQNKLDLYDPRFLMISKGEKPKLKKKRKLRSGKSLKNKK